jgi:hypothetical protein
MKVFNIMQGTDLYEWDRGARVVLNRFDPTDEQIKSWIHQVEDSVSQGVLLWYIATLSELDPQTGHIVRISSWSKQGTAKEKIRLNVKARVNKPRHTMSTWAELLQPAQPMPAFAVEHEEDDE